MYGMTTRSVHQYVLGILEKEGIKEETATKLQVGAPMRAGLQDVALLIGRNNKIDIVCILL
jgi:glutamate dehydrogenase